MGSDAGYNVGTWNSLIQEAGHRKTTHCYSTEKNTQHRHLGRGGRVPKAAQGLGGKGGGTANGQKDLT